MPGKTHVAALINGQATTHDEKLARNRLIRNLNKPLADDQAGEGIREYLEKPDGNAVILVVSEQPNGKNAMFKRAAFGHGLKSPDAGIIIPTSCIDERFSQRSIDALNSKAAQMQQANHGANLDGFYVVRMMRNERDHDAAVIRDYNHLLENKGFRKTDNRRAEGEIKEQVHDLFPAGTNWNPQLMIAAADGELAERLAREHLRMLENNAAIAARFEQRGESGPGATVEIVGSGIRFLRQVAAVALLGIRNTIDEIKPGGVKLRGLNDDEKADWDRIMMGKANDNAASAGNPAASKGDAAQGNSGGNDNNAA